MDAPLRSTAMVRLFVVAIFSLAEVGYCFLDPRVDSVTPNHGSALGGTRLRIDGFNFATDFFSDRNEVFIGGVPCDVIEGNCYGECGGPRRIICDTRSGEKIGESLDVVVRRTRDLAYHSGTKQKSFTYVAVSHSLHPWLQRLHPNIASAGTVIRIEGKSLGDSLEDYRGIYFGVGRGPQGGNEHTVGKLSHAQCRTLELNFQANNITGVVDTESLPVTINDPFPQPIEYDVVKCRLDDFEAGSFDASIFLGSKKRTAFKNEATLIPGLAASELPTRKDALNGRDYVLQFFPTITKITPDRGSWGGGQYITIEGSGFALQEELNEVFLGGRRLCEVLEATHEEILCWTYPADSLSVKTSSSMATSLQTSSHSVTEVQASAAQLVGDWTSRSSYRASMPGQGSSHLTFVPELPAWGDYEVSINFPAAPQLSGGIRCIGEGRAGALAASVRTISGYVAARAFVSSTATSIVLGRFAFTSQPGSGLISLSVEESASDSCLALLSVSYTYRAPFVTEGSCDNAFALNQGDLLPCIYDGGRGVQEQVWTSTNPIYKAEFFAGKQKGFGTGESCSDKADCGDGAFCRTQIIGSENDGTSNGWKLIFRQRACSKQELLQDTACNEEVETRKHGVSKADYSGLLSANDSSAVYSRLGDWNYYRRADGMVHLKLCWPQQLHKDMAGAAGPTECFEWLQDANPLDTTENRREVNIVPIGTLPEKFGGLQSSDMADVLLDGLVNTFLGKDFTVFSTSRRRRRRRNVQHWNKYNGQRSSWTDLYVMTKETPAQCVSCQACYESDGQSSLVDCPASCIAKAQAPKLWNSTSIQQLVLATDGLQPVNCSTDTNAENGTECDGVPRIRADEVPASMSSRNPAYRLGGVRYSGLFVAPHPAVYTIELQASDAGELWLSPDSTSARAELVITTQLPESNFSNASVTFNASRGEARWFELVVANDEGEGLSQLKVATELEDGKQWASSSDGLGLSAEYFHVVAQSPTVVLMANGMASQNLIEDQKKYAYSNEVTPKIFSISPASIDPGQTITITGTGFLLGHADPAIAVGLVTVKVGPINCTVGSASDNQVVCTIPANASGGHFPVHVHVEPWGNALGDIKAVIRTSIDTICPTVGSLAGGATVTIIGKGFADFGAMNNVSIGGVRCIPMVKRNWACRLTEADTGKACNRRYSYYKEDINIWEYSQWIDFSTTRSIQCQLERTQFQTDTPGDVVVTLADTKYVLKEPTNLPKFTWRTPPWQIDFAILGYDPILGEPGNQLEQDLDAAFRNHDCHNLQNCMMRDDLYDDTRPFDNIYTLNPILSTTSLSAFTFALAGTPILESITPDRGIIGTPITINGRGFTTSDIMEDTNYYMSFWSFYEQRTNLSVRMDWGGEPHLMCYLLYWNNTEIRCNLLNPKVGATNLPVDVWVLGKGYAMGNVRFSYGMEVVKIRSAGRPDERAQGSLYGGDLVTITLSSRLLIRHPYAEEMRAAVQTPMEYLMDKGGPLQLYVFFHINSGIDFDQRTMCKVVLPPEVRREGSWISEITCRTPDVKELPIDWKGSESGWNEQIRNPEVLLYFNFQPYWVLPAKDRVARFPPFVKNMTPGDSNVTYSFHPRLSPRKPDWKPIDCGSGSSFWDYCFQTSLLDIPGANIDELLPAGLKEYQLLQPAVSPWSETRFFDPLLWFGDNPCYTMRYEASMLTCALNASAGIIAGDYKATAKICSTRYDCLTNPTGEELKLRNDITNLSHNLASFHGGLDITVFGTFRADQILSASIRLPVQGQEYYYQCTDHTIDHNSRYQREDGHWYCTDWSEDWNVSTAKTAEDCQDACSKERECVAANFFPDLRNRTDLYIRHLAHRCYLFRSCDKAKLGNSSGLGEVYYKLPYETSTSIHCRLPPITAFQRHAVVFVTVSSPGGLSSCSECEEKHVCFDVNNSVEQLLPNGSFNSSCSTYKAKCASCGLLLSETVTPSLAFAQETQDCSGKRMLVLDGAQLSAASNAMAPAEAKTTAVRVFLGPTDATNGMPRWQCTNVSPVTGNCSDVKTLVASALAEKERVWCQLPKVVGGIHDVVAFMPEIGRSNPMAFEHKVMVASISHSEVSLHGGTTLTISGEGFSSDVMDDPTQAKGFRTRLLLGYSVSYDGTENTSLEPSGGNFGDEAKASQCKASQEPYCSAKAWYQKMSPIREFTILSVNYTTLVARVHGITNLAEVPLIVHVRDNNPSSQYTQLEAGQFKYLTNKGTAWQTGSAGQPTNQRGCFGSKSESMRRRYQYSCSLDAQKGELVLFYHQSQPFPLREFSMMHAAGGCPTMWSVAGSLDLIQWTTLMDRYEGDKFQDGHCRDGRRMRYVMPGPFGAFKYYRIVFHSASNMQVSNGDIQLKRPILWNPFGFRWVDAPRQMIKYSAAVTPVVQDIRPKVGAAGTIIEVIGSNFAQGNASLLFSLSPAPCEVDMKTANGTWFSCRLGKFTMGRYSIAVRTPYGISDSSLAPVFTYEMQAGLSEGHGRGSVAGGQHLSLTLSSNVAAASSDSSVALERSSITVTQVASVGGLPCQILASRKDGVTCRVPASVRAAEIMNTTGAVMPWIIPMVPPAPPPGLCTGTDDILAATVQVLQDNTTSDSDGGNTTVRRLSQPLDEQLALDDSSIWAYSESTEAAIEIGTEARQDSFDLVVRADNQLTVYGVSEGGSFRTFHDCTYTGSRRRNCADMRTSFWLIETERFTVKQQFHDNTDAWRHRSSQTQTKIESMTSSASSSDILVAVLRHNRYHRTSGLLSLLGKCGASAAIDSQTTGAGVKTATGLYVLIGRCRGTPHTLGGGPGWSMKHNLEVSESSVPSKYFHFKDVGRHFPRVYTAPAAAGQQMTYTYDPTFTPVVRAMSRLEGGTAGGAQVGFMGSRFGDGEVSVEIAGVTCAQRYADIASYRNQHLCDWKGVNCSGLGLSDDNQTLICLTNPVAADQGLNADDAANQTKKDTLPLVHVAGLGYAYMPEGFTWSYVNLWSAKTTWGGNPVPRHGDSIVIPPNAHIFLDVSTPSLQLVVLYGILEFKRDVGDLSMNVSYLVIKGGRLIIGTEDNPFPNKAIITLTGSRLDKEVPVYGAKTIAVRGGTVDMHGLPTTSWVRLAAPAAWGTNELQLDEAVNWEPGDRIIVTSTSFDSLHTDKAVILSVSADGKRLALTKPLRFDHHGGGWRSEDGKWEIPKYSAEVGKLNRNIVVQGDDRSKNEQFGGHMMFTTGHSHVPELNALKVRLSNIQVWRMGQGFKLGRYMVHFHLAGNINGSYVKNISCETGFNRALAIHGVHELLYENNVVFNVRGHAIFIEDGTETNNVLYRNLVAVVRPVYSVLAVDMTPAAFWVTNPNNILIENVAAGSSHFGFWYHGLLEADGVSPNFLPNRRRCPVSTPLGIFLNNTAHSTVSMGLRISDYTPTKGGASCGGNAVPEYAVFKGFTGYKNGLYGVWGRFLVAVSFEDMHVIDHKVAGFEVGWMNGMGAWLGKSWLKRGIFVGSSRDKLPSTDAQYGCGANDPECGCLNERGCLHAINVGQMGSRMTFENITMVNYEAAVYVGAWAEPDREGGYESWWSGVTKINVDYTATFYHTRSGILTDVDGSLTGQAGGAVAPPTDLMLRNPNCRRDGWAECRACRGGIQWCDWCRASALCTKPVRRVSLSLNPLQPYVNYENLAAFPEVRIYDATDLSASERRNLTKKKLESLPVATGRKSRNSCLPQAPFHAYLFTLPVDRYLIIDAVDQVGEHIAVDLSHITAMYMQPEDQMVLRLGRELGPNWFSDSYAMIDEFASSFQFPNTGWGETIDHMPAWDGSKIEGPYPACVAGLGCGDNAQKDNPLMGPSYRLNLPPELNKDLTLEVEGKSANPRTTVSQLKTTGTASGRRLMGSGSCLRPEGDGGPVKEGWPVILSSDCARWYYGMDMRAAPLWNTTRMQFHISPRIQYFWCLGVQSAANNTPVRLYPCEDYLAKQSWGLDPDSGRLLSLVSSTGTLGPEAVQRAMNGTDPFFCVAEAPDGIQLVADPGECLIFSKALFMQTNVTTLHASSFLLNETGMGSPEQQQDPTFCNYSCAHLDVVLAGNSSVSTVTLMKSAAAAIIPYEAVRTHPREFKWCEGLGLYNSSDPASPWWVHGDPDRDLPKANATVIIWPFWNVTLDCSPPFRIGRLDVQGNLTFERNSTNALNLRVVKLDVSGLFDMGSKHDPIVSSMGAGLFLEEGNMDHGSSKVLDIGWDGKVTNQSVWQRAHADINGHFFAAGAPRTRCVQLRADAAEGSTELLLSEAVSGWSIGDRLLVTTSLLGKNEEYIEIEAVSDDGKDITAKPGLQHRRNGRNYILPDGEVVDLRARVCSVTRNVQIKLAWSSNTPKSELWRPFNLLPSRHWVDHFFRKWIWPAAVMRIHDVAVHQHDSVVFALGSSCAHVPLCAGIPKWMTKPEPWWSRSQSACGFVSSAGPSRRRRHLGFDFWKSQCKSSSLTFEITGSVVWGNNGFLVRSFGGGAAAELSDGHNMQLDIHHNVLVGAGLRLSPDNGFRHNVESNVVLRREIKVHGTSGYVNLKNNLVMGVKSYVHVSLRSASSDGPYYYGIMMERGCSSSVVSGNIAMANTFGWLLTGCNNFRLKTYRNSVGVFSSLSNPRNILAAENGINFAEKDYFNGAQKNTLKHLSESVIIGDTGLGDGCESRFKMSAFQTVQYWMSLPELPDAYLYWKVFAANPDMPLWHAFGEYSYTGVALGSDTDDKLDGVATCGMDYKVKYWTISKLHFVGFSGKDSCGRLNVAISNEKSGLGQGTKILGDDIETWYGSRYCMPLIVTQLNWTNVLPAGRLRFSDDHVAGFSGHADSWANCYINDDDGTLLGTGQANNLVSGMRRKWQPRRIADCKDYIDRGYDLRGENPYTACVWWMRLNKILLHAAYKPEMQGTLLDPKVIDSGADVPEGVCTDTAWSLGGVHDNHVYSCTNYDLTYVLFKWPKRTNSGSLIKWGPIGVVNAKRTTAGSSALYARLSSLAVIENNPEADGHYFTVPNRGYYRLYSTGDIDALLDQPHPNGLAAFSLPFDRFGGSLTSPRAKGVEEHAVIISFRLTGSKTLNFFYRHPRGIYDENSPMGRPVSPVFNERALNWTSPAGSFFQNLRTNVITFLLRGPGIVYFRTLEVVQVTMGLAVTFDTFFAENNVDPSALHPSFPVAESLKADWSPDYGNIVKSDNFVRNLAGVLQINPFRIRVVNVVPGGGRRLTELCDPWECGSDSSNVSQGAESSGLSVSWQVEQEEEQQQAQSEQAAKPQAAYNELVQVSRKLATVAAQGSLDVGYEVTEMAVQEPKSPSSTDAPTVDENGTSAPTDSRVPVVIKVTPVTHTCGDAKLTSAEECDDGNLKQGDGCSDKCVVETGWECTNVPQQRSSCKVLSKPAVSFSQTDFGTHDEGTTLAILLERSGPQDVEFNVTLRTQDAGATSSQVYNGENATNSDYTAVATVVHFGVNVTSRGVEVRLHRDSVWSESLEMVQMALSDVSSGAQLGRSSVARFKIRDLDSPPLSPSPSSPPDCGKETWESGNVLSLTLELHLNDTIPNGTDLALLTALRNHLGLATTCIRMSESSQARRLAPTNATLSFQVAASNSTALTQLQSDLQAMLPSQLEALVVASLNTQSASASLLSMTSAVLRQTTSTTSTTNLNGIPRAPTPEPAVGEEEDNAVVSIAVGGGVGCVMGIGMVGVGILIKNKYYSADDDSVTPVQPLSNSASMDSA